MFNVYMSAHFRGNNILCLVDNSPHNHWEEETGQAISQLVIQDTQPMK